MRLWRSVERLAPLAPDYVSVTYGAGGTTRDRTRNAIKAILERARLQVAGHLTCVGASRAETLAEADGYRRLGARRIVALRGDPPKGAERFEPHPDGFRNAAELTRALREAGHDRISVAAYPEFHPESGSPAADLDNLKRKLDAGAAQFRRLKQKCRVRADCLHRLGDGLIGVNLVFGHGSPPVLHVRALTPTCISGRGGCKGPPRKRAKIDRARPLCAIRPAPVGLRIFRPAQFLTAGAKCPLRRRQSAQQTCF